MLAQILALFSITLVSLAQSQLKQSMGILINYKLGTSQTFKDYIKHFHDPICTAVTEFNIVVSAEATLQMNQMQESLKYLQKNIPINYLFTSEGQNFHFKMKVSNISKADIYYLSNMNVKLQGCESIIKLVFLMQRKAYAGVMGLIGQDNSLSSISSDLVRLKNQFIYTRQTPQHYAIVQNIRLVSRHILQLSQSNITQIVNMRKQTKPICEDIFLNFVSAHFYPELRPSFEQFQSSFVNEANNLESSDKQKTACVKKYVEILGYLPVFYNRRQFTKAVWINPNLPKIIQLKKLQLIGELQKEKQGKRLLSASSNKKTEIQSEDRFLSTRSQQIILIVLRVIVVALLILLGLLTLQSLLISMKEKKNRDK